MEDILKKDGLSFELLEALSYRSELGIRLKKNLHYFDKQELFKELIKIHKWYLDPIEIQYNTYYDRQLNNWLHKYVYKRKYKAQVGYRLRQAYESGKIKNESEFKEALGSVLSDSEEIR